MHAAIRLSHNLQLIEEQIMLQYHTFDINKPGVPPLDGHPKDSLPREFERDDIFPINLSFYDFLINYRASF